MEQRPASAGMSLAQPVSVGAAGLSFALFALVALVPLLLGHELECFPDLKEALKVTSLVGGLGLVVAFAAGLVPAFGVAFKKAPPTFGRLGGVAGGALVFALLSTPLFGTPVRLVYGMSWGHWVPTCQPSGLLGQNPELWNSLSRSMGYRQ
jgi:hypothetical protein